MKFFRQLVHTSLAASLFWLSSNLLYAQPLITKFRQIVTVDGWVLTLKMDKLNFTAQASAGGLFSKEILLSFRSWAGFSGKGKYPVTQGVVDHGVQLGCGIDVSDGATLGLSVSVAPTIGLPGTAGVTPSGTATVGGNAGGQAGGNLGANGGPNGNIVITPPVAVGGNFGGNANFAGGGNGAVNGNVNGNVSPGISFPLNITPNANLTTTVTPSITAHVKPGVVNMISLVRKNLVLNGVIIDSYDTRLGLDGCLGPASLRAFATISISTVHEDTYINIYSDPIEF